MTSISQFIINNKLITQSLKEGNEPIPNILPQISSLLSTDYESLPFIIPTYCDNSSIVDTQGL